MGDMSVKSSTIACLRRRGLLLAMFALASCESDSTPLVQRTPSWAETRGGAGWVYQQARRERPPQDHRLRPADLTGEYSLDGNGVLSFPLIGNVPPTA